MRFPGYAKTQQTGQQPITCLPSHWDLRRLRFLAGGIEQGWSPQCDNLPVDDDGWGVMKVGCVNGTGFDAGENKALPPELEPLAQYELRAGDVLVSRANTRELVGSAALVSEGVRPRLLLCDKLFRLNALAGIHPRFLVYLLRTPAARFHYEREATGRAKAMVVTDSRLHAVRYKRAFDAYFAEKGYTDVKTLVAFSGTVEDPYLPGQHWTEVGMNQGIKESELPERFDSQEYQLLLVAEKYQTGFDQPLLHTMYVDRTLTGLRAVQTLSRLNRTCAGKEDCFVLDFRNRPEEIFKAFKPYYEDTPTEPLTDPQHLYRLHHDIEEAGLVRFDEVREFCAVYFKPRRKSSVTDHEQMNGVLDHAVQRFKALAPEEQDERKAELVNFRNLYGFLSQVIPYQDSDLEQLYTYLRFLLTKLPRPDGRLPLHVEDEVELEFYRLQKIGDGRIDLNQGEARPLKGPGDVGTGQPEQIVRLSELIDLLNERFGTDFTQADQLFFDQIQEQAVESEALRKAAASNSKDDFRSVFERAFEGLVIDRMDGNEEIFGRLMADGEFRRLALEHMLNRVYGELRKRPV